MWLETTHAVHEITMVEGAEAETMEEEEVSAEETVIIELLISARVQIPSQKEGVKKQTSYYCCIRTNVQKGPICNFSTGVATVHIKKFRRCGGHSPSG